jgi:hypothetical protein
LLDALAQTIERKLRFAYTPADQDGDPDGPDDVTVSAYGGLVIAEDGDGRRRAAGAAPQRQSATRGERASCDERCAGRGG